MAISVDWPTGVISVPKADTVLFGTDPLTGREIRTFDTEKFHKDLRSLEESEDGRPGFPRTHDYDSETTIDGVNYAAKITMNLAYYTVTFENGDYRVILQNTNNNIAAGTTVNNVSIQPSNSAGLVGSEDIRNQSFLNAEIVINTDGNGFSGTQYPTGAPHKPSDNYSDAKTIAMSRNYHKYNLDGTLVLGVSEVVTNTIWRGNTPITSILVFTGQDCDGMSIERCGVTGTFSPTPTSKRMSIYQCALGAVTDFYGIVVQSAFNGTINIYNGSTTDEEVIFDHCSSAVGGNSKPELNINGMPSSVQVRHYSGGLKITNCTSPTFKGSFDGDGRLEIDATCTDGEIVVGGNVLLTDNSGAGCTVIVSSKVDEIIWNKTLP